MSPSAPAASKPKTFFKTLALTALVAATATAITYEAVTPSKAASLDAAPSRVAVRADSLAKPASPVDTSLISRLLPNSSIRGVEKLDMGKNTYVWEVDMLADEANPDTAGFVYLSADGSKLLNGPLMDKRSKVMMTGGATGTPQAPRPPVGAVQRSSEEQAPQAPQEVPQAASLQTEAASQQQSLEAPEQAVERQVQKAAAQREMFLSGIEQLPYISTTQGSHAVYVLFDPLCSACAKLYKQHKAIAAAYDVEFRWIPIFNNEVSYPLSALLRKTFDQDHSKGLAMMDDMLNKTFKADDHIQEISALTPGDYGLIKPAGSVFLEITRAVPGIGTPFVMFKNSGGKAEAFGGVPLAGDWASLK